MARTVRADTGVDLGAVIQDAACVGKRLESPLSVVLAHPRVAYPSELKIPAGDQEITRLLISGAGPNIWDPHGSKAADQFGFGKGSLRSHRWFEQPNATVAPERCLTTVSPCDPATTYPVAQRLDPVRHAISEGMS
jgi:hypothetical protein